MAPLRGAGQASFDATFEMESDGEFSGFYAKNVELAVTVYPGMFTDTPCRYQLPANSVDEATTKLTSPTSKTWTLPAPTTKRL